METTKLVFRKRNYRLAERTLVMAALNVTPDSFSDGGRYFEPQAAIEQGLFLAEKGADILDIGGESTRPGSRPLPWEEETRRVLPVVAGLARQIHIPISIDTRKSQVAERAIGEGAEMINDISALRFDPRMAQVAFKTRAHVVLMHMQGEPQTMQLQPQYGDLICEIMDFLRERLAFALSEGIGPDRIILDPGLGFGKSIEKKHNLHILRNLGRFKAFGKPLLVGPSRKSFIGNILNLPPLERDEGTMGAVAVAILNGASMVRVHEVERMSRFIRVIDAVLRCEEEAFERKGH